MAVKRKVAPTTFLKCQDLNLKKLGSWKDGETKTSGSVENTDFTVTFQVTGSNTSNLQGPSGLNPNDLPTEWNVFLEELNLQSQHQGAHGVVVPV